MLKTKAKVIVNIISNLLWEVKKYGNEQYGYFEKETSRCTRNGKRL